MEQHQQNKLTGKDVTVNDSSSGCYNRAEFSQGYTVLVRDYVPSGDYSLTPEWIPHTMSRLCRQTGVLIDGKWIELRECAGCLTQRDTEYIETNRRAYEASLHKK